MIEHDVMMRIGGETGMGLDSSGAGFAQALDPVLQAGPPLVKRPLEKLAAAQVEDLLTGLR